MLTKGSNKVSKVRGVLVRNLKNIFELSLKYCSGQFRFHTTFITLNKVEFLRITFKN